MTAKLESYNSFIKEYIHQQIPTVENFTVKNDEAQLGENKFYIFSIDFKVGNQAIGWKPIAIQVDMPLDEFKKHVTFKMQGLSNYGNGLN